MEYCCGIEGAVRLDAGAFRLDALEDLYTLSIGADEVIQSV